MKQLQLIGNIGQDAVLHQTNGNESLRFTLAVTESWKDANGNKKENTLWVTVFIRQKGLQKWLTKGSKVFAQGKPAFDIFRDNKGNTSVSVTLNADRIELLHVVKDEQTSTDNSAAKNDDFIK